MQEAQDTKPKKKLRWLRRVTLILIILAAACIAACQVHYYRERRTPEVRGVVVDIETGKPVQGADVAVTVYGFPADLIAAIASPPRWELAGGILKTDSKGQFSFPEQRPSPQKTGVSWLSYVLWGPMQKHSIGVFVHARDYVTLYSQAEDFSWKEDPVLIQWREAGSCEGRASRTGDLQHGFQYMLEIKRAVTEKEWDEKSRMAINYEPVSLEPSATWRFEDLMGYLERWPEGKNAKEYLGALWQTAALGPCDYLRPALARGALSKDDLKVRCDRASRIISLSEGFARPPEGMDADSFQKGLQSDREVVACAKELLETRKSP